MLADAHRNALAVENGADIVGMDAFQHEGYHPGLVLGIADDAQAVDRLQLFGGIDQQIVLVGGNRLQPDRLYIVDGGAKADGFDEGRRAGLEFMRNVVVPA